MKKQPSPTAPPPAPAPTFLSLPPPESVCLGGRGVIRSTLYYFIVFIYSHNKHYVQSFFFNDISGSTSYVFFCMSFYNFKSASCCGAEYESGFCLLTALRDSFVNAPFIHLHADPLRDCFQGVAV